MNTKNMNKHIAQKVGYARVSSRGQSLNVQIDKLQDFGCCKLFQEKISGTDQNRPELLVCLDYVRLGDTLVVTKLDRMARSVLHLQKIAEQLEKKSVYLVVLDQKIDTTTPQGKLMFNMLSVFAEFENDLRKERQADGIKKAIEKGIQFGRPSKINADIVIDVKRNIKSGLKVSDILKKFKISRATYYLIKKGEYDALLPDDYKLLQTITLTLEIDIAGINKITSGIKQARIAIENTLNENFMLIKLYKNATDYHLTLEYIDDVNLADKIKNLHKISQETASKYHCCVEISLRDNDGNKY